MTLVAKKTVYQGYKFNSRLEATWACYFDLMGVPWLYEVDAYNLDGLTYIPDFWLPELKMWLEIKGELMTDERGMKIMEKARRLAVLSGHPVILTFNDPLDQKCVAFGVQGGFYPAAHFTLCPHCGAFGLHVRTEAGVKFLCPKKGEHREKIAVAAARGLHRALFEAAQAVRQRRFGIQ